MNAQRVIVVSFIVCCLIIAWGDIGERNEFPRPSRLVSAGIAYTLLGIVAAIGAPGLAAALGIGLNVGQMYQLKWANGDGSGKGLSQGLGEAPRTSTINPFGI